MWWVGGCSGVTLEYWGFPGGSDVKESACNAGDPGSVPESGQFPREGNGYPLQYSCLSHKKKNEILAFVATWMVLEGIMLSEKSQRKTKAMISLTCVILKVNNITKQEQLEQIGDFQGGGWGRSRSTGRLRSINSSYKVNESRG